MMENRIFEIGFTGRYIEDHPFNFLCEIPVEAAVAWVKKELPETMMGGWVAAKDLTVGEEDEDSSATLNGWVNKLFVIVASENCKWIALVNRDKKFSIYVER